VAGRDLTVRIRAEMSDFNNKVRAAKQGITDFNNEVAKSSKQRQAINDVGTAFGKLGLLAAGGLGASAKAAMDWESAWAGVTKTVDGSAREMAVLEEQLRQMARTMPATHQEIAAVAEAAGQLGVQQENIASFTKTMVQLGETTNLSADEAATSIAQMTNIMQTAPKDVDNLAATLVSLGNNGASTERDIIQMAQNIAGAGKIVGLTEGEILAVSNALASVGIEAEAGGSSVSKIFMDMAKAVKTGSPDLALWASTAEKGGLAAGTFTQVMADSPAVAFDAFTKGLGAINTEGGDVFTLLGDLGQSDIRVNRSLLGMAGAGDLLSDSLALQGEAWKENAALTDEYAKRAETSASKAQIAWNGIKDNGIDIGNSVLPVIKDLSDAVADLTDGFSKLPKPLQDATGKALALTAILGGSVFVGSRVITGIANMRNTFDALGTGMDRTTAKTVAFRGGIAVAGLALGELIQQSGQTSQSMDVLGGAVGGAAVGSIFGPWGAVIGGAVGALTSFGDANEEQAGRVDILTRALDEQTGAIDRNVISKQLAKEGAYEAGRELGLAPSTVLGAATGNKGDRAEIQAVGNSQKTFYGSKVSEGGIIDKDARAFDKLTSAVDGYSKASKRAQQNWRDDRAATGANKIAAAFKKIPKVTSTTFKINGSAKVIDDTAKILANTKATPKQIRTELVKKGWDPKDIEKTVDKVAGLRKKPPKLPIDADDKKARRTTQGFVTWANGQTASVYIGVRGPGASQIGKKAGGIVGFAGGGVVPGTGPADGSDNVAARTQHGTPYAIRSGEWIINERQSRLNDRLLHAINSGADFSGFASGGRVGGGSSSSPAGPLRISGELTLSADGRAFIEGVALEQAANLSAAESRMSRAAVNRRRA
jgi:TP901 family phage tail tape measure protein